ncbi:MAG: beta strand repeat-containing protein, partial [Candidatus Thalassarchaeaceae archaeon]
MTVTTSGGSASGCGISSGATDVDADGNLPFAISSTCAITVNDAGDLNYESGTQSFTLNILATDGSGAASGSVTISVTNQVIDISAASATIAEDTANNVAVVTLASTGDSPTNAGFTISSGNGNGAFAVAAGGAVTVADTSAIDYDTATSQTVVFTITDGTNAVTESVVISFTDVNDQTPAVTVAATYTQAESTSTAFQTFTMVDSDSSGSYDCTLGGNDAADFTATASGKVCTVVWAAAPNYESAQDTGTNNVYDITISFTDGTNTLGAQTTAITVTDVNEAAPVFGDGASASASVAEVTTVGTYTATDADGSATQTYSIVAASTDSGSVDHDLFSINSASGALTFSTAPNYEDPGCGAGDNSNTCVVILQVTDGANTDTITVTATVTDLNEAAPEFGDGATATANVAELATTVGTYSATDADGTASLTYSIVAVGTNAASVDHDLFSIVSGTGALTFAAAPNYEAPGCGAGNNANTCVVVLSVTDGLAGSADDTITVTVTVTDLNEAAPVFSDGASASANVAELTTTVDTYGATDADGTASLTYSIVAVGANAASVDHDLFAINSASGALTFASAPDFETPGCGANNNANTCVVVLSVTDGVAGTADDTITITVTVTDVAPSITASQTANLAEDASVNDDVMTVSTTGDAATAFVISAGNSQGVFKINAAGLIEVASTSNLDFESTTSYTLTILAADATGTADIETVAITITDVNEAAPEFGDGATASANVAEGSTTVGTYSATDADTA